MQSVKTTRKNINRLNIYDKQKVRELLHLLPTEMFKWGKAEVGQQELESHRQELDGKIQLLEAKYRDAENAYRKMCAEGRGIHFRKTAFLQVQSLQRRIQTASNLQLKLDRNLEALEAASMAQSVMGSLTHSSTKVLQNLPGKEGAVFDMLDDNEIALEETSELVNALSGAHDTIDDDLERMLAQDMQKYGNIQETAPPIIHKQATAAISADNAGSRGPFGSSGSEQKGPLQSLPNYSLDLPETPASKPSRKKIKEIEIPEL